MKYVIYAVNNDVMDSDAIVVSGVDATEATAKAERAGLIPKQADIRVLPVSDRLHKK